MAAIPTGKMFTRRSMRIAHALGPPRPASPITSTINITTPSLSLLRLEHTQSHTPPPHPRPTLGDCTLLPSTKFRTRPLRLTIYPPITTSRHRHYTSSSFTSDPNSPTPPPPSTAPIANAVIPAPERTQLKVTNPKKSDAGTDMLISITPRAVDRLHHLMSTSPHSALRITVEPGGCHGFQYFLTLIDLPPTLEGVSEEDTIFDQDGARVVIDESSLQLLNGSKVDYTMELIGRQFRIVDGPGVKSSCGCGTSFDVKM